MKGIAILAAAALVTLAGCDRLRGGGAAANNSIGAPANAAAGNQAAEGAGGKPAEGGAAVPAASAGPGQLDRDFLVGRWTDDGDCSAGGDTAIEFTRDGRFIAANGGTGLWNLDGDELTMSGSQTATIRLVVIDRDTMTVVNSDGSLGRSTRC
ncbi:MAG: hypothetical protein QOH47_3041 [Sphingomonadales bacterium]|jgi:hypothetical protein|nr:hypothetical protein [Sphingomonadales bacterium]